MSSFVVVVSFFSFSFFFEFLFFSGVERNEKGRESSPKMKGLPGNTSSRKGVSGKSFREQYILFAILFVLIFGTVTMVVLLPQTRGFLFLFFFLSFFLSFFLLPFLSFFYFFFIENKDE